MGAKALLVVDADTLCGWLNGTMLDVGRIVLVADALGCGGAGNPYGGNG